ncbi:GAF domain-containing protein [Sporosarcina gallistercoris]|uniref:GAF domain-containing protein n=1 Tax=Sporosarcina gallistercoris TaxID=2762245 RepID=A0ABR8PKM0_9BACL|nr:GAF domain-containing protein [Sporosarcina gallistercoris]MBD7908719.1 GAF domain-containing protein [Sporosarcina gallistercoris]
MESQAAFNYQQQVEEIRLAMGCDFVALALVQSEERHFQIRWEFASGNLSQRFRRIVLHSGKGVAGIVFKTGKPIFVPDAHQYYKKEDMYNYPILIAEELESFAAIPLFKYNRVKGILLAGCRKQKCMSIEKFELLQSLVTPTFGPYYSEEVTGI